MKNVQPHCEPHLPVADKAPSSARWMLVSGTSMRLTPAAMAALVSLFSRPMCARWRATMDEEHAVSIPIHGPAKSLYVSVTTQM